MPIACSKAPCRKSSLMIGNQDLVMVLSGILPRSLDRVGLYSIFQGCKNQMDIRSKINSLDMKSD